MLKRLLLALTCLMATNASAADLQILAGSGFTAPLNELAAEFEKNSGHKLTIRYGAIPDLIKWANADPFDLVVVPSELFADAGARARFSADPTIEVARVGIGVAVRSGTPKPDISTAEAFKQALLKAQSVAFLPGSATGAQILKIFERLGIGDAMKVKTRAQATPPAIVQAVANGEAELAIFLLNILNAPGVDIVGPFPPELQQEIVYTAGIAGKAREPVAAKAFLAFLQTPSAKAVIKAKGLTPPG